MSSLSETQKTQFWEDGFITIANAVTDEQLLKLKEVFSEWVEESRRHNGDFGETIDGRFRFDVEPGHNKKTPGLRRVQSPEEVSEVYNDTMRNSKMVDYVADLIGPSIRFHHGKINSKLPGTATKVSFHQDFLFQPMSNDDLITALLFLDEVTLDNGPLEVIPKTHKGPLYSHWHEGVFTGSVSDEVFEEHKNNIYRCTGESGSVCLMHSNLLHGSAPNISSKPRTLYIATYYAEDAIELSQNHVPSKFTHDLIRGTVSGRLRCSSYEMLVPEFPKETSFFAQQAKKK